MQSENENSRNLPNNQENIVENQNNENISKENGSNGAEQDRNENGACENGDKHQKHKKSKKRKSSVTETPEENQPSAKILKMSNSLQTNDNESDKSLFDWKQNVLDIMQAKKNEISLKKLQNKIIKRYERYISNSQDIHNLTDEEREKATAKLNKTLKKLKKSSVICISEDIVKLI
jgi:hypothetical protein